MVKIKYIVIVVLAIVVGIFAYNHFFQSEESKVKKRFDYVFYTPSACGGVSARSLSLGRGVG